MLHSVPWTPVSSSWISVSRGFPASRSDSFPPQLSRSSWMKTVSSFTPHSRTLDTQTKKKKKKAAAATDLRNILWLFVRKVRKVQIPLNSCVKPNSARPKSDRAHACRHRRSGLGTVTCEFVGFCTGSPLSLSASLPLSASASTPSSRALQPGCDRLLPGSHRRRWSLRSVP